MTDAEFLDHIERLRTTAPPDQELVTLNQADYERLYELSDRWTVNSYAPQRVSRSYLAYLVNLLRQIMRQAVLAKLRS
jgi:hypothetical protein